MKITEEPKRTIAVLLAAVREYLKVEADPLDVSYRERYAAEMIDGFRVLSLVVFAATSALALAHTLIQPPWLAGDSAVAAYALILVATVLGLLTSKSIRSPARVLVAAAMLLMACVAVMTLDCLHHATGTRVSALTMTPLIFSTLMLCAAVLPLRPFGALCLGVLLLADCGVVVLLGGASLHLTILDWITAGTAVAVAVVVAARSTSVRIRMHHAFASAIAAERQAEAARERAMFAESAVTMERLAAALSHELNTPVGVLKSATETLSRGLQRHASFPGNNPFPPVVDQLTYAISQSTERLCETVARIQRFANLDRSSVRFVDLNQLIQDAIALMNPMSRQQTSVQLKLHPLPDIWCRPQALSSAIASILNTVLDGALDTTIRTHSDGRCVFAKIVSVCGDAQSRERTDLGFAVVEGRVRSSGWDLFTARQIARQHGGEVRIYRPDSKTHVVTITLPVNAALRSEDPLEGDGVVA